MLLLPTVKLTLTHLYHCTVITPHHHRPLSLYCYGFAEDVESIDRHGTSFFSLIKLFFTLNCCVGSLNSTAATTTITIAVAIIEPIAMDYIFFGLKAGPQALQISFFLFLDSCPCACCYQML